MGKYQQALPMEFPEPCEREAERTLQTRSVLNLLVLEYALVEIE